MLPQDPGGLDGISPHPEEVGGVQIHPHQRAGLRPQAQQRLGVVNQLHPVVLQGDALNAALCRQPRQLPPLGDRRLVPLVVQNLLRLRRPGGRNPHRRPVPGAPGGQAAHHHDLPHPQQLRQAEGLHRHLPVPLIGQGIAGAVQGAEVQAPPPLGVQPPLPGGRRGQQALQVRVGGGGPVARADLQGLNPLPGAEIQHLLIGQIQGAGLDGKPHGASSSPPPGRVTFLTHFQLWSRRATGMIL